MDSSSSMPSGTNSDSSEYLVKIYDNGREVNVEFWKQHIGHDENDVRGKGLLTMEKNMVVEKLKSGISDRILEDARKFKTRKLERITLVNTNDLIYLLNKYNIQELTTGSVVGTFGQYSQVQMPHQEEINQFMEEKSAEEIAFENWYYRQNIQESHLANCVRDLNNGSLDKFMKNIQKVMKDMDRKRNSTRKRKMAKKGKVPAKKR